MSQSQESAQRILAHMLGAVVEAGRNAHVPDIVIARLFFEQLLQIAEGEDSDCRQAIAEMAGALSKPQ